MTDTEASGTTTDERPIYIVPVPGTERSVRVSLPSEAQIAVFSRILQQVEGIMDGAESTAEKRALAIRNVGLLMSVVDRNVIDDRDKNWLDYQLVNGNLELLVVLDIMRGAITEHGKTQADTAPAAGPVRVKRARAK